MSELNENITAKVESMPIHNNDDPPDEGETETPRNSRKRLRADDVKPEAAAPSNLQDLSLDDDNNEDNNTTAVLPPTKLQRLRVEAMFHPKFDNEQKTSNNTEQNIRHRMQQLVSSQKGYLEVSLKHSGSLVLWSGGQRYYSKNATDNLYSHAGEVLLRQHFGRAYFDNESDDSLKETHYQECSDFVETHRLTLAFEVVTSILGHHGELPQKDFLILTAVADRTTQTFYSTLQLLKLAHRFRLPHNDVWIFQNSKTVERLFGLYDTTRETGMARDTVASLNEAADAHVSSLYPHLDFQGNLLEGLVIRYVSSESDGTAARQWEDLAETARDLLRKVPPERPPSFALHKSGLAVLTTDLRTLDEHQLESSIRKLLDESDPDQRRQTVPQQNFNLLGRVRQLSRTADDESKRIAQLVETLESLKSPVRYHMVQENNPTRQSKSRWLCSIHVLFDPTHKKFRAKQVAGGMDLFRGFTIELAEEEEDDDLSVVKSNSCSVPDRNTRMDDDSGGGKELLMLKMKFLPYMVRTFGCRNGLSVIATKGPTAFNQYTMNLMTKWGISPKSMAQWQPFFGAWGVYAKSCLNGVANNNNKNEAAALPPLTEATYLHHLDHFMVLYKAGKISDQSVSKSTSTFRGLVVVASLKSETSKAVASYMANRLGGLRVCDSLGMISTYELTLSCVKKGGGIVCGVSIGDGVKKIRQLLGSHGDSIFVVMFGCDDDTIDSTLVDMTEPEQKRTKGQAHAWRKSRCGAVIELETSSLTFENMGEEQESQYETSANFDAAIDQLKELSQQIPVADTRPGLLVFFPGIPGMGKSALSNSKTKSDLISQIKMDFPSNTEEDAARPRNVIILMSDEIKKKYWPFVTQERGKDPACICIADKNATPAAWLTVGDACFKSSGVALPVLPDAAALQTTSVTGAQMSDGSFEEDHSHFYPFSLHYLAACMARVLRREPGKHPGKLDHSFRLACMVVVRFFSLYRSISADDLVNSIQRKIRSKAAMTMSPIVVPFFTKAGLPELPPDLRDALIKALQIQYGYDIAEIDYKDDTDSKAHEIERELRSLVKQHSDMLLSLCAEEAMSRQAFVSQLAQSVSELSISEETQEDEDVIKICSVDVDVKVVHGILRDQRECLNNFFLEANLADDGSFGDPEHFIMDTHVTMVHCSEISQSDLRRKFEDLVGSSVEVTVRGLLYSPRIAALEVEVAKQTLDDTSRPVPPCGNAFSHISLWRHDTTVPSFESNKLPSLVEEGNAVRISFAKPRTIQGNLSFWGADRSTKSS